MIRLRIGALLSAAAIVFAACGQAATSSAPSAAPGSAAPESQAPGSSAPAEGTPKEGGTLVVAIPGDINRTDPSLVDDATSTYVLQQVVETLVTLEPGTGDKIVPALAESWTVSDDGLTYTFKLRQGVKFHDGTALDAAAVKANFDRWLTIPVSYGAKGLQYTYYIDVVIGKGDSSFVKSVEAPDASTVVITLRAANSAFLTQMTLTPFGIQSPKAMEEGNASAPDFKDNKYAQGGPPTAVGTGPFKFKDWVPKDHITLEKNADYWNKSAGGPYLDAITFKPIDDVTATLNALQSQGVDIAQTVAPTDIETVKGDTNLQYMDRGSACNAGIVGMNQTHKPFDNLKIRQAVGYALNRQAIVDALFGDSGVVINNWVPPGTLFAKEKLDIPDYNPDMAKQLIQESGVTDLSFDFWYFTAQTRPYAPDPKAEFEAFQRDLEAVGFKPNPKSAPWKPDYLAAEGAGKYPIWLIGWNCDWLGIDNFLYTAFFGYRGGPPVGPNPEFAEKNDEANKAMLDALAASDEATQQQNWDKAQDLIAKDFPAVPIVSAKTPAAAQAYVKGVVPSPTLLEIFTNTWLDK
jgi:peptide/nickel transport system substrate-binding protein